MLQKFNSRQVLETLFFPLKFPSEEEILSCMIRFDKEHVIAVQFLEGQQDVSSCRLKTRKQVEDASSLHVVAPKYLQWTLTISCWSVKTT